MRFEWDILKELENIRKHKIPFSDSVATFKDPLGFVLEYIKHSKSEIRHYWLGKSEDGRILTTYFTRREDTIRIIGCAEWRKFGRYYYETTKTN